MPGVSKNMSLDQEKASILGRNSEHCEELHSHERYCEVDSGPILFDCIVHMFMYFTIGYGQYLWI